MSMDIVDIHPHAISKDTARYPPDPLGGTISVWARERPADAGELLAAMDGAGIGRAVLVQPATAYSYDNSYAADSAAANPERFLYVGMVDVRRPDAAARVTYWVRERGMAGLRIYGDGTALDTWLDDPATYPAWEAAATLGIPVCVQTSYESLPILGRVLARFPGVPVLLDHCAWPPVDDGPPYAAAADLFALARYPNLHLKLTEALFRDLATGRASVRTFVEQTLETFGAGRLAWGSNVPSSAGTLVSLRDLALECLAFLSAADRRSIFCDVALALYPRLRTM
jgi:predicted TIM-barrel fold metal-dependent hydrolase